MATNNSCKAASGISNGCTDLLRVGGLDKTFWIFYKSQLDTQISLTQVADINVLDFGPYGGLLRFDGQKFSHEYTSPLVVANTGNRSYAPTLTIKILSNTTAHDVVIQQLNLGQDIVAIVQNNNNEFLILGAGKGLYVTANTSGSGLTGDADTSDTITLTGAETTKPLRFSKAGGYQATLDYLTAFEIG
jgi:hypothetical protein